MNKQKRKGKWANNEKIYITFFACSFMRGGFIGKKCLWAQFGGLKSKGGGVEPDQPC